MTLARSAGSVGSCASAGRDVSSSAIESTAALAGRLKFFMVQLSSDRNGGSRSAKASAEREGFGGARRLQPSGEGFSLTILWTRRHDFPVGQRDHPKQSGRRAVPGATG